MYGTGSCKQIRRYRLFVDELAIHRGYDSNSSQFQCCRYYCWLNCIRLRHYKYFEMFNYCAVVFVVDVVFVAVIHFKILITTYKCIYREAPKYLCNLLLIKEKSSLLLRSSSQILWHVALSRLKCYGGCAFRVAGQSLWNRLPGNVYRIHIFLRLLYSTFQWLC